MDGVVGCLLGLRTLRVSLEGAPLNYQGDIGARTASRGRAQPSAHAHMGKKERALLGMCMSASGQELSRLYRQLHGRGGTRQLAMLLSSTSSDAPPHPRKRGSA